MPALQHSWDLSPQEAITLQRELSAQVKIEALNNPIHNIVGVDMGFPGGMARAAVAVLSFPELQLIESAVVEVEVAFPYIPGLLSFREIPAIVTALARLKTPFDLLLVDGQGIAHPRRFGIASHLGMYLDTPSIGCAKSILTGKYQDLGEEAGSLADLKVGDEVIGMAVRSRAYVKPLIVSVGHRITLEQAVQITLACTRGYRLPEPARWAHRLASGKTPLQA